MPAVRPLGHPSVWFRDLGFQVNLRHALFNLNVLIFHGYLLRGTGSNVYNARLTASMSRSGANVHLLCQERHAPELDFVDAVGDWESGELRVRTLREPVRLTVYRPPIGRILPVYVADRYEGFEAKRFADCTDEEIEAYVARNVEAVQEVAALAAPDVALANHLVMGPAILARALDDVPYAVKIHGSALEYTVKPDFERFGPWAREGLARARGVLVGSRHTAESLWEAMDDPTLPGRTRLGPPGVDVQQFTPREQAEAEAGLHDLAARLAVVPTEAAAEGDGFARDHAAAALALAGLRPGEDRLIAFVGKLLAAKGVDLLAAAFPLVLAAEPRAKLVIVGFGEFRDGLQELLALLAVGDLEGARAHALRGGERGPLHHLHGFLEELEGAGDRAAYLEAAARLPERCVLTGRLEHEELADLLPACEAQVVSSTFPEAFGMVAAEAAACGALPVSAAHSGLAEVTRALAPSVPEEARPWLSFAVGPGAVRDLASSLVSWLRAPQDVRDATRSGLVEVVRDRYSWEGVARTVIHAARGELSELDLVT
jgi:glycosyltransferase involved in cell wall biosynthesis